MTFLALATDYDGTIAHHGDVEPATVDALQRLKDSGRKLLLVTGREIPDLLSVFGEPLIFDQIVAENGALLYDPKTKEEQLLTPPPPRRFADLLLERGVNTLSVGRVIVATLEVYEGTVREIIRELGLESKIIMNKGSVMILPPNVDKATGLAAALRRMNLPAEQVVGVGDAENDHALLRLCGFGAAVANALPELKAAAKWTAPSGHGKGVRELIEQILADDLASVRSEERTHAAAR